MKIGVLADLDQCSAAADPRQLNQPGIWFGMLPMKWTLMEAHGLEDVLIGHENCTHH